MKNTFFIAGNGAVRSVTSEYIRCSHCGRERRTTEAVCVCADLTTLYGRRVCSGPIEARVSRIGLGPLVAPDPETEPKETVAKAQSKTAKVGFCDGLGWVCAALILVGIVAYLAVHGFHGMPGMGGRL